MLGSLRLHRKSWRRPAAPSEGVTATDLVCVTEMLRMRNRRQMAEFTKARTLSVTDRPQSVIWFHHGPQ
jgi:hypothetical protein